MAAKIWLRFALMLMLTVALGACGDSDDSPAQPPPTGTDQPTDVPSSTPPPNTGAGSTVWNRIRLEDLSDEPIAECQEADDFTVQSGGAWRWEWCDEQKSGDITAAERTELDSRVRAVVDAGIGDRICLEIAYAGNRELSVNLKPDRNEMLHEMNIQGSCFRAPQSTVNPLEEYVEELRTKYAGFTTQPANR